MRYDVVDLERRRRPSLVEAFRHHGFLSIGTHPAKRVPGLECFRPGFPAPGIAALALAAAALLPLLRVSRTGTTVRGFVLARGGG